MVLREPGLRETMLRAATIALLSGLALAFCTHQAGAADCEIISATHSAETKGEALLMSQALAAKSANALRQTKGWRKISMSPHKVKPDPFWKNVRPAVPEDIVWASFVTARTYTVCFTGVVVAYVCTSGSRVCPN
jgi:hypothetical protein